MPPNECASLGVDLWALVAAGAAGPGDRNRMYGVSRLLNEAVALGTPVVELPAPRSDADDPDPPPQHRVEALCRILGRGGATDLTFKVQGQRNLPAGRPGTHRLFSRIMSAPPDGFVPNAVKELHVDFVRVEPMARLAMFRNLRSLQLKNVAGSRDELMTVLRELSSKLDHLSFRSITAPLDVVSLTDVIECVPRLRELVYACARMGSADTARLRHLTNLESLVLIADEINFHHVLELTQLRSLKIDASSHATDDGVPLDAISRLTRLTSLDLVAYPEWPAIDAFLPAQLIPTSLRALGVFPDMLIGANHLTRLSGLCELTLYASHRTMNMGYLTALSQLSKLNMDMWQRTGDIDQQQPMQPMQLPALRELHLNSINCSEVEMIVPRELSILHFTGNLPTPLTGVVAAVQQWGFNGKLLFDCTVWDDDTEDWGVDEWRALTTLLSMAINPDGSYNGIIQIHIPSHISSESVGVLADFLRSAAVDKGAKLDLKLLVYNLDAFATVSMAIALSMHNTTMHINGRVKKRTREWVTAVQRHCIAVTTALPRAGRAE